MVIIESPHSRAGSSGGSQNGSSIPDIMAHPPMPSEDEILRDFEEVVVSLLCFFVGFYQVLTYFFRNKWISHPIN